MRLLFSLFIFLTFSFNNISILAATIPAWKNSEWDKFIGDSKEFDWSGDISKSSSRFEENIGEVVSEVAEVLYAGFNHKKIPSTESKLKNKFYYGDGRSKYHFFTTDWIETFVDLLKSVSPKYSGMNEFVIDDLSQINKNYIESHLIPALEMLSHEISDDIDFKKFKSTIKFDPGSFSGVIISTINNNTGLNFNIYQNDRLIGMLTPGENQVALYGASYNQGDIIFIPDGRKNKASWRVSFKKAKDILDIANDSLSRNGQSTINLPFGIEEDDQFLTVQVTDKDFSNNSTKQMRRMIERTQCINLSQLKNSSYITLQVEDEMSLIGNGDSIVKMDKNRVHAFYPSISFISPLVRVNFPFFRIPDTLKSSAFFSSWIEFLNIVVGVVSSNYEYYSSNVGLGNYFSRLSAKWFVIKEDGELFGDLSSPTRVIFNCKDSEMLSYFDEDGISDSWVNSRSGIFGGIGSTLSKKRYISSVTCGLPATEHLFTADIPDKNLLDYYLQLHIKRVNKPLREVVLNLHEDKDRTRDSVTIDSILSIAENSIDSVGKVWINFVFRFKIFATERSDLECLFSLRSDSNAVSDFFINNPIFNKIIQNLKVVEIPTFFSDGFKIQKGQFLFKEIGRILNKSFADKSHESFELSGGLWGQLINDYNLKLSILGKPEKKIFYKVLSDNMDDLFQNKNLLKSLLVDKIIEVQTNSGDFALINSYDCLRNLLFKRDQTIDLDGDLFPLVEDGDLKLVGAQRLQKIAFKIIFSDETSFESKSYNSDSLLLRKMNEVLVDGYALKCKVKLIKNGEKLDLIFNFYKKFYNHKRKNFNYEHLFKHKFEAVKDIDDIKDLSTGVKSLRICFLTPVMEKNIVRKVYKDDFLILSSPMYLTSTEDIDLKVDSEAYENSRLLSKIFLSHQFE